MHGGLGLGLAVGEAGVGVRFDDAGLAQALGLSALVLILAEGGLNDPPAVLAVTLLSDIGHHTPSPALIAGEIAWQLAGGAAIGVLAGVLGAQALRRVALPASGLYPIAILALIVASYGAATLPLRVPRRQQAFLSWAGLRGAVPIVLATIPMNAHVPGAIRLFDIVFIIVVINTLAQGPTLPWAARRLKVTAPAEPLDVDVEAAPLEVLHADLLQAQIPTGSRLHGVEIFELRLPAQANIALIVRDGKGFVPSPTTTLRTGDRLLIVAAAAVREQTERRLRAVGRAGKLAGWFGEHGL